MALADNLISGEKKIAATNTAEQVTTNTAVCTGLLVRAAKSNAENIRIGGSGVGATSYLLEKGESIQIDMISLSRIWIYGKENDVVYYLGAEVP